LSRAGDPATRLYTANFLGWGEAESTLRRPLTGLLYRARVIDDDECGEVGGMRIGTVNQSTLRRPAPLLLCPPQIPYVLTWTLTRTAAEGSHLLSGLWHGRYYRLKNDQGTKCSASSLCFSVCLVDGVVSLMFTGPRMLYPGQVITESILQLSNA
jgi:hypothetical protein